MTIRHDQVICGTTTTGSGALTMAAAPAAITSIDPFACFSGSGWGTSVGVPVQYEWTEYTDTTFTKPLQFESGRGVFLLGANLAACTLTRTTPMLQASGMNSPPATQGGQVTPPSPLSIGTAANVLVLMSAQSWSFIEGMPYYGTGAMSGADLLGFTPDQLLTTSGSNYPLVNGQLWLQSMRLSSSQWIKTNSIAFQTGYTGGTTSQRSAIYDWGSDGRASKLLIDFGVGTIPAAAGIYTHAASAAIWLPAGHYVYAFLAQFTGGSGAVAVRNTNLSVTSPFTAAGTVVGPCTVATVAGQTVLNDPCTLTSVALRTTPGEFSPIFKN